MSVIIMSGLVSAGVSVIGGARLLPTHCTLFLDNAARAVRRADRTIQNSAVLRACRTSQPVPRTGKPRWVQDKRRPTRRPIFSTVRETATDIRLKGAIITLDNSSPRYSAAPLDAIRSPYEFD